MTGKPYRQAHLDCLHYWDMASTIPLDAAVALWCGVEPGQPTAFNTPTNCMDAKREVLIDALRDGRLDYDDRPVPRNDGNGMWHGAGFKELIEKDGIRITKKSLRRFFMEFAIPERPPFLFDESRQSEPLPDGGEVAEINTMLALALMARVLANNNPSLTIGGRPNADAIGKAINKVAMEAFGEDVRGFASIHKKISKALKLLDDELNHTPQWR